MDVRSVNNIARITSDYRRVREAAMTAPDQDVCYLPGHVLLERFRSGDLSPVEVLERQIERIEATNHSVNAISERLYESARVAATESTRRYRDGTARPLEGLTVAVKE